MKPIEAGCLCLVVGLKNMDFLNGKSVMAVRRAFPGDTTITGFPLKSFAGKAWVVHAEGLKCKNLLGELKDKGGFAYVYERNLMRIDGHEQPAKTKEAEHA